MLLALLILALAGTVRSLLINVTIDDRHGDERTGMKLQYDGYSWDEYPQYDDIPDFGLPFLTLDELDGAHNRTLNCRRSYHEPANASLTFNGTAIYVPIARRADASINMTFYRDGISMPVYQYFVDPEPPYDSHRLRYNQLAFKDDQLAPREHSLTFVLDGVTSYDACFDYAIYTMDDGLPSPTATTSLSGTFNTGATSPASASHTRMAKILVIYSPSYITIVSTLVLLLSVRV